MVRLTDRPKMILDVYRGRKQQLSNYNKISMSKLVFSSTKKHMHIFNMLITSVQSFRLIA